MLNSSFSAVAEPFGVLAFSGSRNNTLCIDAVKSVFPSIRCGVCIYVGDALGVDAAVRVRFPRCAVYEVADYGVDKSAFARRSAALVADCVSVQGLFCSFPAKACPVGVMPSRSASACFCGKGSGSWASLAYAVGLGCACFVSCAPLLAPSWLESRAKYLGGGSWFVPALEVMELF